MISRRTLSSLMLSAPAAASSGALSLIISPAAAEAPSNRPSPPEATDWRETYAYTMGLQAYIFGFPWIYMPSLRWGWVTVPKPEGSVTPYAPFNHFYHVRKLANASYRGGGSPNNDTLYSMAWVDVSKEPIYIQAASPGKDRESNWLPATQSGGFLLIMRTYMPGPDIIQQKWTPPGVIPAG